MACVKHLSVVLQLLASLVEYLGPLLRDGASRGMKIGTFFYARSVGVLGGMLGWWQPLSVMNVKLAFDAGIVPGFTSQGSISSSSESRTRRTRESLRRQTRSPLILQRTVVACRPCARLREAMVAGGYRKEGRA